MKIGAYILALLLLVSIANAAPVKNKKQLSATPTPRPTLEGKTALRAEAPEATFEISARTKLRFVRVGVKNIGQYDAKNVYVLVVLPSGEKRKLSGPKIILSHETASYERALSLYVAKSKDLAVELRCNNCYR